MFASLSVLLVGSGICSFSFVGVSCCFVVGRFRHLFTFFRRCDLLFCCWSVQACIQVLSSVSCCFVVGRFRHVFRFLRRCELCFVVGRFRHLFTFFHLGVSCCFVVARFRHVFRFFRRCELLFCCWLV